MYPLKAASVSDVAFLYLNERFFILPQNTQFWETKNDAFHVRYEVSFDPKSQKYLRWILY
jgi:hypothetical protein